MAPRPGALQRGNTAKYDPQNRRGYRTTVTFLQADKPWLTQTAKETGLTVPKLLIDVVRRMQLDWAGNPTWASDGATEYLDSAQEEFEAAPGERYRVTVTFPPAVASKVVELSKALSIATAEVIRAEIRHLRAHADPISTDGPTSLPVQLALPLQASGGSHLQNQMAAA